MHLQKPKGCQNNRQTLYYSRSTFCANSSTHLKLVPLFSALGGATKSRFFHSSRRKKGRKMVAKWSNKPCHWLEQVLRRQERLQRRQRVPPEPKMGEVRKNWKAAKCTTNYVPFSCLTVVKKRDFTMNSRLRKCAIVTQCLRRLAPKVDQSWHIVWRFFWHPLRQDWVSIKKDLRFRRSAAKNEGSYRT